MASSIRKRCSSSAISEEPSTRLLKYFKSDKLKDCKNLELFLSNAPHELIIQILAHLSRNDIICLASTSKSIRKALLPYIFDQVKCAWHDMLASWKQPDGTSVPIQNPELIEKLRITSVCSKNEWTFPFHELFSADKSINKMKNLRSLELPTSGSTNFLKYCQRTTNLNSLDLHAIKGESIFSLEHVKSFPSLTRLKLTNYHIDDFDEDPNICPHLQMLQLENCTWCYPFNLENFGKNKITTLNLTYSTAFIMSERFRSFLTSPGFTKLEELTIVNSERNLKLTISLQIMNLINAMPSLKVVKLAGNIYNETLNNFTAFDLDNCINYVALNDVKVFYSSFLRDLG